MKHIYHGTIEKDLAVIRPFKRFTPGGAELADKMPPRIYASYNQAYAVAHSFPWSSDDGVDITIKDGVVILMVPHTSQHVLKQEVSIYALPDSDFVFTTEEETGLTYHSTVEVAPLACQCFKSVTAAMDAMGGKIELI